jgi:hypothetical protein
MEFKLIPPPVILSRLKINSLDDLKKNSETFKDERILSPLDKLLRENLRKKRRDIVWEMGQSMGKFYHEKGVHSEDVHYIIQEILKNSIEYGPIFSEIFIGVYGTLDFKMIACNDGGDHFTKYPVKIMWESKEHEKKCHNFGMGQSFIYGPEESCHEIVVDTRQGTLYVIKPVIPL